MTEINEVDKAAEVGAPDETIEADAYDEAIEADAYDEAIEADEYDEAIEADADDEAIEASAYDEAIEVSAPDEAAVAYDFDELDEPEQTYLFEAIYLNRSKALCIRYEGQTPYLLRRDEGGITEEEAIFRDPVIVTVENRDEWIERVDAALESNDLIITGVFSCAGGGYASIFSMATFVNG